MPSDALQPHHRQEGPSCCHSLHRHPRPGPESHSPAIGLHVPRPDHRPSDALQPDHRPEGPSRRTATACIVTHHRDLRCPARPLTCRLPSTTTGRLTPSPPPAGGAILHQRGLPSGCPGPNIRRSLTTG
ncbi:hypothetical protein Bbelb_303160 [Branchiostoma belcheri]|nr:hypothetical protein Bbelb_303160 [Branchiostoma belcheri]